VIHFFWDRILGTYRRPDARFRGQKGVPNQLVSDSKPHLLSRCDLESNAAWKSLYGVNLGPSDLTVKSDLSGDAVGPVLFSALEGMMAFALVAGPDLTLGIEPSEFTGETLLGHVGGEDVLPVRSGSDNLISTFPRSQWHRV
jgi:hypothetical protein